MKILFVCKANHGRSQLAAAMFNKLANGRHWAISAGTRVVREESNGEGQKMKDLNAVIIMKKMGVDISENVRHQLTPEMLESVDRVVVMAEPGFIPEYLRQSDKAVFWDIPDTYNQSLEFVRDISNRLQALIGDFIETLDEKKIKPWKIS